VPEARELLDELGCSLPMPGEMMHWRSDFEWWLHKAELLAAHRDDIRIGDQPMLKVMGIDIKVSR
jgi:hypothetical protein